MGKVTLLLPDELQAIVDREVEAGDFPDDGAFIENLIREHHARKLAALVEALEEGERSGISPLSFDEIIAEARERYRSRAD
jgi:Arc/MetJ-type ribon-helix-helix transcriptional regulator